MTSLIDDQMVELIRSTGNAIENVPNRVEIMESLNLPYDRRAENVIIMGCQNLKSMPGVIQKFARILNRVGMNLQQAEKLGARRLILLCSPCYPIYKYAFPEKDIIFYPQAIHEAIGRLEWPGEIDYYAGCYRLHRNFAPVSMDLDSTNAVFRKIDGLSINRISAPACCFKPEGLAHMINQVKTDCMVHICTGCYFQALSNMPEDRRVRILMVPEFIDMIQGG